MSFIALSYSSMYTLKCAHTRALIEQFLGSHSFLEPWTVSRINKSRAKYIDVIISHEVFISSLYTCMCATRCTRVTDKIWTLYCVAIKEMNCFFCGFPLMAVGVLDSALDRLRSSRSPLRQIAGSFWKAWILLFLWWRDPLVLHCKLNAKLYNVYYAWGMFVLFWRGDRWRQAPF